MGLFYLRLVLVAYGKLACSFLLTVEVRLVRFGPLAYGESQLGLFYLLFPPSGNWVLVFSAYGSPV